MKKITFNPDDYVQEKRATGIVVAMLVFGIFFTLAACGDILIISLLWRENRHTWVLDHPSEVGCFVYRKK